MTVVTVVGTVLGFLSHYAEEATAVSGGFNALIDALPLSAQDKENIRNTLKPVFDAPEAILKSLENFHEAPPVVHISATDIQNAVQSFLSTALPAAVKTAVADYMNTNPVNGIDETTVKNAVAGALPDAVAAYFVAHPFAPNPIDVTAMAEAMTRVPADGA